MTRISFDIEEFKNWLETLGCDCCMLGWLHLVDNNIIFDWESNIQYVITKYKDIKLVGELIEEK
ncbi:hypothetical protein LCGC14_2850620 [marine sediment metagenome]|uniref:Uncharacterized protein n=1 Tax=marine sediment metagenome TaxID=412755 RepID=A0A0F9AZE6_9ZZZZ